MTANLPKAGERIEPKPVSEARRKEVFEGFGKARRWDREDEAIRTIEHAPRPSIAVRPVARARQAHSQASQTTPTPAPLSAPADLPPRPPASTASSRRAERALAGGVA